MLVGFKAGNGLEADTSDDDVATGAVLSPGMPPCTYIDCDLPDACLANDPFAGAADVFAGEDPKLIEGEEEDAAALREAIDGAEELVWAADV